MINAVSKKNKILLMAHWNAKIQEIVQNAVIQKNGLGKHNHARDGLTSF